MRRLLTAAIVLLLSGCGAEASQSGQPTSQIVSSGPTPSPSSARPTVVVLRTGEVAIVDLQGKSIAAYPLPTALPSGFVGVVGIGASDHRALIYDTRNGDLWALFDDGRTQRMATLPTATAYSDVLVGPTGQWVWTEQTVEGVNIRTRLHLVGPEPGEDRVVQELTDPNHALRPYRWDGGGLVVEVETVGRMSSPVFDPAVDAVELVDVTTGAAQRLPMPNGCWFAARSADGTIACVTQTTSASRLSVVAPDGSVRSFDLPRPTFTNVGNTSFHRSTAGDELVVGGYDGSRFATATLELAGEGHLTFEVPQGIAPASGEDWVWLDDVTIVGIGWRTSASADEGVWVYGRDGTSRRISAGTALGVLHAV